LNFEAALATAKEVRASGGASYAVAMDVADDASVDKAVADALGRCGRIGILVGNSGIQIVLISRCRMEADDGHSPDGAFLATTSKGSSHASASMTVEEFR
jgi:NAD(P)-dependent dehydrogenase (short-subunit alcohol dehydrogenase family)